VAKAIVTNPVNAIVLDGGSVNAGLQVGYTSETFGVFLGGLAALDESINTGPFDRFFDLVATASLGDLSLVANADVGINTRDGAGAEVSNVFWGGMLGARYALAEQFGVAARGEYVSDEDGIFYGGKTGIVTGTLTLDYKPNPNVVLRWDNRIETADADIFFNGAGAATGSWFESVVGAVVHTEGLLK
jgi:Putative beta-barrel porin-2, OmpL-like. bbp2